MASILVKRQFSLLMFLLVVQIKKQNYANYSTAGVQTFGARRLKVVSSEGTPANWEYVPRVIATVVIKGSTPSVKGDQHLNSTQCTDRPRADKVWIFPIHRLQLHSHLERVLLWSGRLLLGKIEAQRESDVDYWVQRIYLL